MNKYLEAYKCQKTGAKKRGIEFELTFDEWLEFWGDDIDRRGTGKFDLQMQRLADSGPYALGNIKKGTPRENMITMGLVRRTRNSGLAAEEHQRALDKMMYEESAEPEPELSDDEQELAALGMNSSYDWRYSYVVDQK